MIKQKDIPSFLYYAIAETSLGWIGVSGDEQGLWRLVLPEKTREGVLKQLNSKIQFKIQLVQVNDQFSLLINKIREYFLGIPVQFDNQKINLSRYTIFQRNILLKTREIPYGQTRSYRWIAEQAGYAKAYRAAGGVMRINPIPLIIPCHRVISSQGKLTGFSATDGLELKQKMLALEGRCHG